MKKSVVIISIIFLLFSCGLEKQNQKVKNNIMDEVSEKTKNLENYILLGAYNEKGLDIKYENKNIEKIKQFLHKKNLSGINLENIKGDLKNILLLIKNNINKNIELSITLKYPQLNDENLSVLMDYNVKKLLIMIAQNCDKKAKNFYVSKKIGEKIINRKIKNLSIALICKNNVMEEGSLIIEDEKQLEKLKNDVNFEFIY